MTNILIVEDDMMNMKLVSDILDSLDLNVHKATDGFEALKMVDKDHYDMIIMDIELPVMDGIETTRKIKAIPRNNKIPIIALTAFAMKGDREKFLDLGFDHYMSKPIHVTDFINLINEILEKESK
ncbi:MAG: response regulator [Candidatus Methanoperedens sp.]|nr:response regulator [Candidatus Methanoperedens sp.]